MVGCVPGTPDTRAGAGDADADELRGKLKAIAADGKAPGSSRTRAIHTLTASMWPKPKWATMCFWKIRR